MDIDVHQPVPGRLQQHLANWESYGVAESVLRIIREDYSIPLTAWPKRRVFTNNYEPSLESFMQTKLQKFISLGVVEAQPSNTSADLFAHVINPIFAVDKKDGDIRWILDLRYVNKYCTTFKFKLGILIVPKYTSASWYQLLHRFGYSQLGRLRDCLARGIDLPPDAVMPSPEVQLLAFYLDCR